MQPHPRLKPVRPVELVPADIHTTYKSAAPISQYTLKRKKQAGNKHKNKTGRCPPHTLHHYYKILEDSNMAA